MKPSPASTPPLPNGLHAGWAIAATRHGKHVLCEKPLALGPVQASFGFSLAQPAGNLRMDTQLGGGTLLDAGSYPLSLSRLVMGQASVQVRTDARWAGTGADDSVDIAATLKAPARSAREGRAVDLPASGR